MTAIAAAQDPHRLGIARNDGAASSTSEGGPAPKRIVVGYGFWIFLLSDFVLFSGFFAAYAVLSGATAGGPSGHELFDATNVAIETACLLASSFCCGLATIAVDRRRMIAAQAALAVTGLLGLIFVLLEAREFWQLIAQGNGPGRSAFLTSFFTLVGCHGLHVTLGGLWLATMMAQLWFKGFRETILLRFYCFSLFWHALDIIWVAIFTLVYLMGIRA